MLRQTGTLPPQSKHCFYDYLSGAYYTCAQGRIQRHHPTEGNQQLQLMFHEHASTLQETYLARLVVIQGQAIINTEGTIATCKLNQPCTLRSTRPLTDRSCWQFHVPGSLYGVQLGICYKSHNSGYKFSPFTFNCSTSRTITFMVDKENLKAWVNESSSGKKNNNKHIQWNIQQCYPYARLTSQGSTVIFNPFSVQPNSKISRSNPFNSNQLKNIKLEQLTPVQLKDQKQVRVKEMRQINLDTLLLIDQNDYAKVVFRDQASNRFSFSGLVVSSDAVFNLFTQSQWATVSKLLGNQKARQIKWDQHGYKLNQAIDLLRQLIIKSNQCQRQKSAQQLHILLTKLSILRPYAPSQIPNAILNCQTDRQQHQYSLKYFNSHNLTPIRMVSASRVTSSSGWFKLDGHFADATNHFILASRPTDANSNQITVNIYYYNKFGIRKVFSQNINQQQDFSKSKLLQGFSDIQTNLWKQQSEASEIYKILSNCFSKSNTCEESIYQPKQKDIKQLTQIFKINNDEAVEALEQTGNIQDALAWLADSNRKSPRRKKAKNKQQAQNNQAQQSNRLSLIQLGDKSLIVKILLQVNNKIYTLGFNPKTFANKYIQRTEKGFMNLSTFQFVTSMAEMSGEFINQGTNFGELSLLDQFQYAQQDKKENLLFLFAQQAKHYAALINQDGFISKISLQVSQQNAYREQKTIKSSSQPSALSNKQISVQQILKTNNGQLLIRNQNNERNYLPNTIVSYQDKFFSNFKALDSDQLTRICQVWVEVKAREENESNSTSQSYQSKYLPLLVQHGPPGCNMNYPICSILYPKAPLPFLANYPYALTFRHLHSKCMKVSQVVIQRIGEKHNVNQIKQGNIYFVDDAGVQSNKYKFRFDTKNQLNVEVSEQKYWRYMVIEPAYNLGSKLPYEIGFLGAKGTSIQLQEYQQTLKNKIEQNIQIEQSNNKYRFQITKITPLSQSCYKATISLFFVKKPDSIISISSKNPDIKILMSNTKLQSNRLQSLQSKQKQAQIKSNQISTMSPAEIVGYISKPNNLNKTKDKKTSVTGVILREISKNDAVSIADFDQNQIKILVDMYISSQQLQKKDYARFYDKIKTQSPIGYKYLQQLVKDIGKGYLIIGPNQLRGLLSKSITKEHHILSEHILHDLLDNVSKIRNDKGYQLLRKQFNNPYLLLEENYYSKYYYSQIQGVDHQNTAFGRCDPIFRESSLQSIKFVSIRENKYRKILLKLPKKSSVKNLVLRLDKSQSQNKAYIKVSYYKNGRKVECAKCLLYEHQWIQITKNPYRAEMGAMFGSNIGWLNGYGICFGERVQCTYLAVEIMFCLGGLSVKESGSGSVIEIVPEVYGYQVGQAQPNSYLEQSYFKFNQQQKILLSKIPSKLQIQSQKNLGNQSKGTSLYRKYLINKPNIGEYQYYEDQIEFKKAEKVENDINIEYLDEINGFVNSLSTGKKNNSDKQINRHLEKYHTVMRALSDDNSQIRIARKLSLDYCYTVIMWILQAYSKNQIVASERIAKHLLQTIVKNQIGPITLQSFKAISKHPDLFVECLKYIKISANQDQKTALNTISSSFIKANTNISITDANIKTALQFKDAKLAQSLTNLIIDTKQPNEDTIRQCIQLAHITRKNDRVINFILKNAQDNSNKSDKKEGSKSRQLFSQKYDDTYNQLVVNYIFGQTIDEKTRNEKFISKLDWKQLQRLIICIRKLNSAKKVSIDLTYLLNNLLGNKQVETVSIDVVSLIFQLNLSFDEQWDYLQQCIRLCPSAQHMIHSQYLSASRQQSDQLIKLAVFHRDILFTAVKFQKNSQLLVNFLGEVFYCDKKVFVQLVLTLPEQQGEVYPLHPDIYSVILKILNEYCNLGGIQGAKCSTFKQSTWLAVALKLLKMSSTIIQKQILSQSQIQVLLKWYLLNNQYQPYMSNPINRSQSINNIRSISECVVEIIAKIGAAKNINKIFKIYSDIKQTIKRDSKKLLSAKYLILGRLQYGVFKLMENNLQPNNLTEILIGNSHQKGLAEEIINQLDDEQKKNAHKQVKSNSISNQIDLTEDIQVYSYQGNNMVNLNCKDIQNYRNGSKSILTKVSVSNKKIYLKAPNTLYMSKFIIGFNIQQTPDKNNILPDFVELYGSKVDSVPSNPTSMKKICDLQPIDDQNYTQYGVKLFGINFDNISKIYRNQQFNFLEIRMKSFVHPSLSDVLQCNQKNLKNAIYHVSFISINGRNQQPQSELSFSNIYMKMLTFLGGKQYQSSLKSFIQHVEKKKGMMTRIIQFLSSKVKKRSQQSNNQNIQQLIISFSKHKVPVLQFLLKQQEVNQNLVNKILKASVSTQNIDFVLQSTLAHTLKQENVNNIIENIKVASLQKNIKPSKFKINDILDIYKKYHNLVQRSINQELVNKQQVNLLGKILTCMTVTPSLYHFDPVQLTKKLIAEQKSTIHFRIIASYALYYNKVLDWFLQSGKLDQICSNLVNSLQQLKKSKSKQVQSQILNHISLVSALSVYPPIKQRMISNKQNNKISRLPIKIFNLLTNQQSLIQQLPTQTLKKFINLFQSTCTNTNNQSSNSCSEQFAAKLIQVMVKLPEVSSVYHNYFIHQFFFHLINAYNGVIVSIDWRGQNQLYLAKPTQILLKFPIRKNDTIIQHNSQYYRLVSLKQDQKQNWKKIILLDNSVVAKKDKEWQIINKFQNTQKEVQQIVQENKNIRIQLKNGETKQLSLNDSGSDYKLFVNDPQTHEQLSKLLTNQTLTRINKPSAFHIKYNSNQPITQGMLPYVYWLPAEMSISEMLKQVNICGYILSNETRQNLHVQLKNSEKKTIQPTQKLRDVSVNSSNERPIIQLEIKALQLFKHTTIQKIAKQSIQDSPKFIPQQTIFKSFQKLKGLQKMIKVIMACVKNWNNQQQSKIWLQYLNQLSSFSCFPIFSSIYMNKQENVELLFNLLSGLPDKEDNKKWLQEEKKSVRFLYDIIKNVFEVEGEQAIVIRNYAVQSGFYQTMLERLHIITKQPKRHKTSQTKQQQQQVDVPTQMKKKTSEQEYKKQIKKKKGIGYGTDSSSNQKWDISGHETAKKQLSDQIVGLIRILEKFLSYSKYKFPTQFLQITYSSAILPILQAALRGGSLLQISKNADLFKEQLRFIRTICSNEVLIPSLMEIPKQYQPKQSQSIISLLTTLEGISKIFLNCLTGSVSQKTSEQIAKDIIQTYNMAQQAIESYKSDHVDQQAQKKILQLPLAKKYPILLKDLRFDYVDMKDKGGKMKHHYNSSYQANHSSPSSKTIRLAQELADISQALPIQHTNAIFVRCDKDRVDFMQALIMGSNGTPYGHGAYLFDIYFDDSYPNNPPKVNLSTTGSGAIRFNPNLYNCGKVCLSLLGTWRGSAMENWDPKVSTLLQVLVSIQSIIMAEQIYFNEPGFEHEQGTVEGQKKNQGYSNIVRYGNIKFAMIQNIKNPPKGFETVIRRHFYLKKDQILQQCKKWLKFAQKRQAVYTGLVNDHNNNWSNTFKKSKTEYKTMLQKAINQLEAQLKKLPQPSAKDLVKQNGKTKKQKKQKRELKVEKDQNLQQIDVTYQNKNKATDYKELDINDEKVKDRWSRYIGAMGLEAVSKQSKANVFLFGLSGVGIEIAKNIVLSGCKRFTVCDESLTTWNDLSGQFYLSQQQIGKNRVQSCLYKLQDLNNYVRVDRASVDIEKLEQQNKLKQYQVVITTIHNDSQIIKLDNYCRKNKIKFIVAKCEGPYGFVFNDFGEKFEVLDKNGEQTVECIIDNITNEPQGVVTLLKGQKHPFEDGDVVKITNVKKMESKNQQGKSINQTVHKIKVINKSSFRIENTQNYNEYGGNGLIRNIKIPIQLNFKSYEQSRSILNIDQNLAYYDFAKSMFNKTLHYCFNALSIYKQQNKGQYPKAWNWQDAQKFFVLYEKIVKQNSKQQQNPEISQSDKIYVYKFSFCCSGSFAPLAAFYGGLVAQQAFKAITSKYRPINQYFLTDFTEVIQTMPKQFNGWKQQVQKKNYKPQNDRFQGLRSIVGNQLLEKIRNCKVFVIGSGAIGCELLKNYAMINIATSQKSDKGAIVVTDPDHIQTSNLNRQFLFREKHLQKPKSATAAAVVKQMNKYLKGENKIRAKLLKVCQATKDTFSNEFFESMDIVTNALDNVQARQYVDLRCVQNKVALLESGTLSTKGHVQVIIPYKTQTYGSKADPAQQGDIPHCTLKMFPEQTLHCVEWARDNFGKTFTMKPKALMKILQTIDLYSPNQSETAVFKDCLQLLKQKPNSFDDAVYIAVKQFYKFYRNDIKQLLYTYPLDAKTKDGKDFWKLPKRPPTPIEQINPDIQLHADFITSYAVLLCKIFNIPYPKDFRTQQRKKQIVKQAAGVKVDPFVPSDKIAKQMASQVEQNKDKDKQKQEQIKQKQEQSSSQDYMSLFKQIKNIYDQEKELGNIIKISVEQFEKDDDANGHIDLIYSMANLRAQNYKLQPMDWITTKLKAGRITPALSTTTSCIAALQTIQLIKYLKQLPIDQMKNTFLNLAVPIVQTGQPGQLQKIKIHPELTTNIWQRWNIEDINLNQATMEQLFKQIQQKYKIKIKTLNVSGGGPIYSDLVMGLESKKQQKQTFMKKKLKEVLSDQINIEDLKGYVDLTLVMSVGDEFIKHVPTIRINFKK